MQKFKNNEPRLKFTGSYIKKKTCRPPKHGSCQTKKRSTKPVSLGNALTSNMLAQGTRTELLAAILFSDALSLVASAQCYQANVKK